MHASLDTVLMAMQADSPQRRRVSTDSQQGVVDAAQFAESMVPEGLLGPALPRNPSQTSLSGAAPGGVLDTGPHGSALSWGPSHSSLSGEAADLGLHPAALPPDASYDSLPVSSSGGILDQGPAR